jgi:hypothetical protein
MTKTVDDYLQLPYTIEVARDEGDGFSGWFARVLEDLERRWFSTVE